MSGRRQADQVERTFAWISKYRRCVRDYETLPENHHAMIHITMIMTMSRRLTRTVFHHREDRIRAHVQLCWLALLLLRVVENATNDTWRYIRHELDRLHLVTLATPDGHVAQRSALTAGQKSILAALKLPEPPRFLDFTVPSD